MVDETPAQSAPAPLGDIEPQAGLLRCPSDGALLYKMITVENLLRSIVGAYLHFNRVDSYRDFPDADPHDGEQSPRDRKLNTRARFARAQHFSAADYYDQSRARTYACCFSLENSEYIWNEYANNSERGKVCVVFDFGRLRAALNRTLRPGNAELYYESERCRQIFNVNYGIIEYVDWENVQANTEYLENPIRYTYLKSGRYSEEAELRISLSALGVGQFDLRDGRSLEFPDSLQAAFDFGAAIAEGTIRRILYATDCDFDFLQAEPHMLRIVSREANEPLLEKAEPGLGS